MNIGEYSIKNKVVSWLLVLIMVLGGIHGFQRMGKLEDPNFTIKNAKIITYYPGATAQQVQDEITYHIEDAIQLMEQVRRIKMSISRPGMSDIDIEFKDKYKAKDFPSIYDELRRKIADMQHKLPPGSQSPIIIDSFADVYGVYLALTGEGYTYRDLKDVADDLKKQLVLVPGVRKVVIGGEQKEIVYVEISRTRLAETGISMKHITDVLKSQNVVADAGKVRVGSDYIRIEPTGEFTSVEQIGDVLVGTQDKKLIYLKDIAQIKRSYAEVPGKMIYYDGQPALSMAISMLSGVNVIAVGEALKLRLDELTEIIPMGMDLQEIYDQPVQVDASVSGFIVSVGQAVAIVIAVLLLFMGVRTGLIIGSVLIITVSGTLLIMQLFGIELQRISLGALVIALGMLVDNAIVVAEGMLVRMKQGMKATDAAREVIDKSNWALIGGTAIGIVAFSSIGLSEDKTGEFASSLFYVILISLSLSWLTAVSTTPLLCSIFLKQGSQQSGVVVDPYKQGFFLQYRNFVKQVIHQRWIAIVVVVALFVLSVIGFGHVKNSFFPNANTPMFFVDIWEPEGADIRVTRDDTLVVANYLRQLDAVDKTTSLIGGGDARFSLVYEPKENSSAYAQIIVQTKTREDIETVWSEVEKFMLEKMPQLDSILKPLRVGPGRDSKVEARFHGPDAVVLRQLSEQAQAIMRSDPEAKEVRDDWRQPVEKIVPQFNEQVARQLGITRQDLAAALKAAFEGYDVGLYREGIRLLPIRYRTPETERQNVSNIQDIQVWSPVLKTGVPIAQVVYGFESVWENTVIRGRDRIQTIIASCNPNVELTDPLFNRLRPKIEALELPPGYALSWGGEFEDSGDAKAALFGSLPSGFLMMILISILLFGKLRQPLIIWLTVPLALIGVTAGLLAFDGAFDFMALLGALSLVGLLIKNAIVLIEEIDQEIESGKEPLTAILDSGTSRLRPVSMAAVTTILGMIPLLGDAFFVYMSITIMCGLAFATVLTLIYVPVLYSILFKIPYSESA